MTTTKTDALDFDVAIVGGGPVGLCFARHIAPTGLNIALIEKSPESALASPQYDGREIAMKHSTMARLKALDIWQRIPAEQIHPLKEAKVYNGNSNEALHFRTQDVPGGEHKQALGYFVSNYLLRTAAYQSCREFDNIHFLTETTVKDAVTDEQCARIYLADDRVISSRLVVAADSRFSELRRKLGISCDVHQFGHQTFVFRVEHTYSNEGISTEQFLDDRTLAILPLGPFQSNCVITIPENTQYKVSDLTPEELALEVEQLLKLRLGHVMVVSDIHSYPLIATHARAFHATRAALIGDAAVGLHPVTAQGFNLGLEGACKLGDLIAEANRAGEDICSTAVLQKYTLQHSIKTRVLYHGTNIIVKLFTNESTPARLFRPALLKFSSHLPGLKSLIALELTHETV